MTDELAWEVLRHAGVRERGALVARHGWSNRAWIGEDVVVRVSSGRLELPLAHEAAVCTTLHDAGFAVARPVAAGSMHAVAPGEPGEWLISERLPGETLADAWPDLGPDERRRAGEDVARFLRSLHRAADLDLDLAPTWWTKAHQPSGYHNAYRPSVDIALDMTQAARALPFADDALLDDVAAFISDRLHRFTDAEPTAFCHTDVHGHNLLVDATTGALTGVLDWEGAHPAGPDVELDMLLRWVHAADKFPSAPDASCRIAEGDAVELVTHIRAAYPELFATPHLRERLEVYEAQWQLVQLHFEAYWIGLGNGDPSIPSNSWGHLRRLLAGDHHLAAIDL